MSDSNRLIVRYIPEVTYNTTPVDGVWKALRYTSEALTATPVTVESSEIRSDRMTADMPKTNLTVGGNTDFELSMTTYDDLIEACICGTWTSDVLETGVIDRSFSFEKEFNDINKFAAFSGMRVGQMSLSMAANSLLTGSFTFAGAGADTPATSLVGGGSTTPATTTPVINNSSDLGSVKIDGVQTNICISSLTLDVNNNLRENNCIGKEAPSDQVKGSSTVTGSVEFYLTAESFDLYGTALTNGSVSLEYTVTDGTNSLTFLIPKAKLSGDTPSSGGLNTDIMFTANYSALIDETEGTNLRITRA